jgi:hypothetical protein
MSPRDSYPSVPELPNPEGLEGLPDRSILILLFQQMMAVSIAVRKLTDVYRDDLMPLVREREKRESDARALRREASKQVISKGVAGLMSVMLLIIGYLVHAAMAGKLGP